MDSGIICSLYWDNIDINLTIVCISINCSIVYSLIIRVFNNAVRRVDFEIPRLL